MRRIFLVIFISFVLFLLELIWFNVGGRWLTPNLLILAVIFFNLSLGVRYSLLAALCAGLLKDSFSITPFGFYLFSFILCAYLTTFLKRYLFHMGSDFLKIAIAFFITVIYGIALFSLNAVFLEIDMRQALLYVIVPEVLITTLAADLVFRTLKRCALKLYV